MLSRFSVTRNIKNGEFLFAFVLFIKQLKINEPAAGFLHTFAPVGKSMSNRLVKQPSELKQVYFSY
jgi:hypothetical protein